MIVAEQKSLDEIRAMVSPFRKVLVLGCGTCVTICFAGGEKEVGVLSSTLRMANSVNGQETELQEATVKRQCEWEFLDEIAEQVGSVDAVLSLACGIGVQAIAEHFPNVPVFPGLNTSFLGVPVEQGTWSARCAACGDCVLGKFAGVCPIVRCSKSLLNGPCGGSHDGKCEISPNIPCGWQLIYDRLETLGLLDTLEEIVPPKDWSAGLGRGSWSIVREDLKL
ncbi:MAG: methylenetetrahydrofolate reductase C-terminal domain-containing protein [Dehalococcoidia bacterium]